MSEVVVLQHAACETLGTIEDALAGANARARYVRTHVGEAVPADLSGADGLVVMGGPMGVYDRHSYPFLADEIELIRTAVREDRPVLGVCLGSQLLAAALGAEVKRGEKKEIGWHPVTLSEHAAGDPLWQGVESPFMAYHWHGDVFELPEGAVSLAGSKISPCQAFRYGRRAYGFLFHMEVTGEIIEGMTATFAGELAEEELSAEEIIAGADRHLPELSLIGRTVFSRWAALP